jgi:integrase/recombinase XerD
VVGTPNGTGIVTARARTTGSRLIEPPTPAASDPFLTHTKRFRDHLALERRLGENTVRAYVRDLEQFGLFLKGRRRLLDAVGPRDIEEYLGGHGWSASTVARKLASLRSFHEYLRRRGVAGDNPALEVRPPRRSGSLPDILSVEEVAALIAAPLGEEPPAVRDRALLEMAYATGLRATELVALTLEEVDVEEELVRVTGKRSRERIVPFGSRAKDALVRYLDGARPHFVKDRGERGVFLTRLGRRFTRMGYWKLLRGYARAAGLRSAVSPHTLRHSCATHLLEGGCDLRVVQEFLGHRSIETTRIYTHLDRTYLRSVHAQFHPRGSSSRRGGED